MQANSDWLYIVPSGLYGVIHYIKEKYGNPTVIISENGKRRNWKHFSYI
jgi:beta-glucosidase